MSGVIDVVGADANNLADVEIRIPLRNVTAVVGPSGSGKSSLVEDTLAAEAAERMQRFLDVDLPGLRGHAVGAYVGQLPPTLFAGQRAFRASTRTTLGTCTGIHRVLRRLFVRFSHPVADDIGERVPEPTPGVFAEWLSRHITGRAIVWAVPVLNQRTTGEAAVRRLVDAGFDEVVVRSETDKGVTAEKGRRQVLSRFKPLRADVRHTIEANVGEARLGKASRTKLEQLLERAWAAADGGVLVELPDETRPDLRGAYAHALDARFHRVHPRSPAVYAIANRHRLSFNAPEHHESGACPTCRGVGRARALNESALVVHPERTMHDGAFALWTPKNYTYVNVQHATIEGLRGRAGFDPDVPWRKLPAVARALVLDGSTEPVEDRDPKTGKRLSAPHVFAGFRHAIMDRAARPTAAGRALLTYVHEGICPDCHGTRWSRQTRALRVGEWSIDRLLSLPLSELATVADQRGSPKEWPADARGLVANLAKMAGALVSVGLGHLSADRGMLDVSDGESRRVRLAGVLTSRLAGLLLVLDEPARGLHEQDLDPLGDAIVQASRLHTVVMSEHRQRLVARAHHLVELGPGAGPDGGQVVYEGPLAASGWSEPHGAPVRKRHAPTTQAWLEMDGVTIHNVRDAHVRIPLGTMTCIAGVSGSGKSSFVRGALVPALAASLPPGTVEIADFRTRTGAWARLRGEEAISALYALDQTAAPAQKRSLVATFLDLAEPLRTAFAADPVARKLGLGVQDFGTNSGRGRCQRCLGLGVLEDHGECPVCGGLRFGVDVLSVRVGGMNLAELFDEPVGSLLERSLPTSLSPAILRSMVELGVGHLSLGRSFDTLSGGEVQRLRIARALEKHGSEGAMFVLDEPAGGLHPRDVERLEKALRHIIAGGVNTVVLVEHDPYLLAVCDHIVEFGPGGGPDGGRVIATGAPADVRDHDTPTGRALRKNGSSRSAPRVEPPDRDEEIFASTLTEAKRVRAEIRQLLGDDVDVGEDEESLLQPAAVLDSRILSRRPYELADIDEAILSILLDATRRDPDAEIAAVAGAWSRNPDLHVQIHPLLDAMSVWGPRVPGALIAENNKHLAAMGLGPAVAVTADVCSARVTGARLAPAERSREACDAAVRDAWALGGGYLELVDDGGKVVETASDRLLDLEAGLVGPRHPAPAHFRRFDARGRCPMCKGAGEVTTIDRGLIVKDRSGRVLDESSIDTRAASVLKGVRRSEMDPFFRRLSKEGLWDLDARWGKLDAVADAIVMHGFWTRPSLGTFLKTGPDCDGSEVNHWLRWDGLIPALKSQIDRSKDVKWREAVLASSHATACPTCEGTGLGPSARLLRLGVRPFDEWVRDGSLAAFLTAIDALPKLSPRAEKQRERVQRCLSPLRRSKASLRTAVATEDARNVVKEVVKAYSGMPVVWE